MMKPGDVIFPFGKHKGQPLCEIPVPYLDWALGIDLSPYLRENVEAYLKTQAEYDQMNSGAKDWKEGREDYTGD